MPGITIREPGQVEAEQLAAMLCCDDILRHELGFAAHDRLTAGDFLCDIANGVSHGGRQPMPSWRIILQLAQ